MLGPCATALEFTTGLWLAAARAERVVRGEADGPTVRDWLAAVNDGAPANAVVMRPIGFVDPERCGQLFDPDRHTGPGWCARVMVIASNCGGSFVKTGIPWDRRPTAVGVVRTEVGSVTLSVNGRGWSRPVSTRCTILNSSTDKGVMVSLHLGSPPEAVGEASLLDLVMF